MKSSESFDKEKASINIARVKKAGEKFELIVEPSKAASFKNGEVKDVKEVLMYEKVFADAKKGLQSSESSLMRSFNSTDIIQVAEAILKEGEIQLTSEYRDSQRAAKKSQIVQLIHRNAIDPRTNLPHPITRIENAMAEAKANIDESMSAERQVEDVIKKLQPIMPIRFETRRLQVVVPAKQASRSYGMIKSFGNLVKDSWHSDGTLFAVIEIPAGLQQELEEKLNKLTHGNVDIKAVGG